MSFNVTLASAEAAAAAPVDVGGLLRTALADAASWTAVMPGTSERLVSLREGPAGAVRMHPLSTLTVKQGVVPLNVPISRFGNARPVGGPQEFRIQQIVVGSASITAPDVVRDHFAPAQFRDLSDDDKLSSPSFQLPPAGVSVGSNADCRRRCRRRRISRTSSTGPRAAHDHTIGFTGEPVRGVGAVGISAATPWRSGIAPRPCRSGRRRRRLQS